MTEGKQEFFQYRKNSETKWETVDRQALSILLAEAGENTNRILELLDSPPAGVPLTTKIGIVKLIAKPKPLFPEIRSNLPEIDLTPGAAMALETAGIQAKAVWMENRRPIPREIVADAHRPRATPEAPEEPTPSPLEPVTSDGVAYIQRIQELAQIAHDQAEGIQGLIEVIQKLMAPFPLNRPDFDLQRFREYLDLIQAGMGRLRSFLTRHLPKR